MRNQLRGQVGDEGLWGSSPQIEEQKTPQLWLEAVEIPRPRSGVAPEPGACTCLCKRSFMVTTLPICLYVICGCFPATKTEFSDRDCVLQS